jgi:hypothetical protein
LTLGRPETLASIVTSTTTASTAAKVARKIASIVNVTATSVGILTFGAPTP